ncbi:transporter substrate-binding domain-containing protein [Paraeggerthella hongkongensis]|uniref:ABC transporter substrate-binding protein n=1 Tax=Paraeggerthella hongkongensis TaxID=230658 RepID=A0A3N0AUF1_9ACTN|nr:transporter substrate-binding domain-containing protein [Paraeggerthella hongkongensis]RNL38531.1 ABC transporter substrate-binding protein [Paraeggerthella hongkongensis]
MKKKLLAVVAVAATLALSAVMLAGCSGGDQKADSAAKDGQFTLTVGFDQSYPPYGYVGDDGQFTGFDLELAKAVAEKMGWNLKLEPIDWDAKDALINSGSINCIWNGFTMEGREDGYTFSEPYMYNEQMVVVKSGSDIKTLEDLKGKIVLTQVDSAALHVLEDEKGRKALADTFKELQTIGDYNNAFMQLESGMVDAVACDLSIASYQMAAKSDAYVKLGVLAPENYAVGFKKGDTELAKQVTDALKQLDEEGFVKQLCEKYKDQGITYDNWVL